MCALRWAILAALLAPSTEFALGAAAPIRAARRSPVLRSALAPPPALPEESSGLGECMAEAWALVCIGAASPADRRVVVPAALSECIGEMWSLTHERVRRHLSRCTDAVRRVRDVALHAIGRVAGLVSRVARVLRGQPPEATSELKAPLPMLPMAREPSVPCAIEGHVDLVFMWRCEEIEYAGLPAAALV